MEKLLMQKKTHQQALPQSAWTLPTRFDPRSAFNKFFFIFLKPGKRN
jgi:hypothetical protein